MRFKFKQGGSMQNLVTLVILIVITLLTVASAFTIPSVFSRTNRASFESNKPNIVMIVTDDQDIYSMPVMRHLMSYPEGSWVNFSNAFVNMAICAPSRATLWTGLYAHNHKVTGNSFACELDDSNTLPVWLDNAGYRTGLFGKYTHGYPCGNKSNYIPPGWDEFQLLGRNVDTTTDSALQFINSTNDPFFLYLAYKAPHTVAKPPARYQNTDVYIPPDHPNFNEADISDKPWVRPLLSNSTISEYRIERLNAHRELLAVDDNVLRIIQSLKSQGVLDNTMIIFLSDNGYSWGSHRHYGKLEMYEESIRIPLLIRYPGLENNRTEDNLVSNVDLASTIAEFAGIQPGLPQDGRSLIPLLNGTAVDGQDELLIEKARYGVYGVRTHEWKYFEYRTGTYKGAKELYDLNDDPYELNNLAGNPAYQSIETYLTGRLKYLLESTPSSPVTKTPGPSPTPTAFPSATGAYNPSVTPDSSATPDPSACAIPSGNLLRNPGFELNSTDWKFYSDVSGNQFSMSAASDWGCGKFGQVTINKTSSNIQLYQAGFPIEKDKRYMLRFDARADGTRTIKAYIHMNKAPNTNLGLSGVSVPLTTVWKSYEYTFTATATSADARLRLWLAGSSAAGNYWFDNVSLVEVTDTPPTATSTPSATPTSMATPVPPSLTPTPTSTDSAPTEDTPTPTPTATDTAPPEDTITPTAMPEESPTPTSTPTAPDDDPACFIDPGTLLQNPGFEESTADWKFYSNASGNKNELLTAADWACGRFDQVSILRTGTNIQLFQAGLVIQESQQYRLRFDARADSNRAIKVFIHLNKTPNTNLGLSQTANLTTSWQTFEYIFTATGSTTDARLRLWFANQTAGSRFMFDNFSLSPAP
jgi:arylsulfatase A-like enzyme